MSSKKIHQKSSFESLPQSQLAQAKHILLTSSIALHSLQLNSSTENTLIKTFKQTQTLIMVLWMFNFIIACEDESKVLRVAVMGVAFDFRIWNFVDAGISLLLLPLFLLVSGTIVREKIQGPEEMFQKFRCRTVLFCIAAALKFSWIIVGLYFFYSFKFQQASDMLIQFCIVYFVGFIGGCICVIVLSIQKKVFHSTIAQLQEQLGINDLLAIFKKLKEEKQKEDQKSISATSFRMVCSQMFQIKEEQSLLYPFLMALTFTFYLKNESSCMDMQITGFNFTFRFWHLCLSIFILTNIFSKQIENYFTLRRAFKLNQINILTNIIIVLDFLISLLIKCWLVVGIVMFFTLPTKACSGEVEQFSIAYFMIFVMGYGMFFFRFFKGIVQGYRI